MIEKRKGNYDVLRALSCLTVVILHVSSIYIKTDYSSLICDMDYDIGVFFRVVSNLAVPTFVMLSGAFLINTRNLNVGVFYKKTVKKILIPTAVFSVFYVLLHYLEIFVALKIGIVVNGVNTDFVGPIKDWIHGAPHQTMWFMYMMIGLYMVTPMICWLKEQIDNRVYCILGYIIFVLCIVIVYTCELSWILWWTQWVGYFMIGNIIYDFFSVRKWHRSVSVVLLLMAYALQVLYWLFYSWNKPDIVIPISFSPVVIIGVIMQFIAVSNMKGLRESFLTSLISKYSLEIYLIHPFLCEVFMQVFGRVVKWFPAGGWIPILAIVLTALCIVMARFLELFNMKILDRMGKRLV